MPEDKLTNIFEELNRLSFRRQQLLDKRNILAMLIQFKRTNGQNEEQYGRDTEELKEIDEELKVLTEKKIQLENMQEKSGGTHLIDTTVSSGVIFITNPPSFPAPQVILDVQQLPRDSCKTQCPFCRQFITTDIKTKVGSATYIVCLISLLFCCVAGCCLIPFCVNGCKDVVHTCPKCRSHIKTCKKF
ncbi:cell death-inducing p53-target 1-like isoform X1 [Labeo rohita]|uniref:Cell death-inducing p53-target 1-like isoform X1 n=1 Tax=Labeo rohita TaxID=84645 RepID=A0A498MMT0_LABRO|nr:U11/U12 small nuclear ribonucleoprotein 25 kDa protein isoform X1 [Labeo rohita]RXN22738.1 cell death-inducing p53-target 1-like isoform X1 [Labeo rohita]